MYFHYVQGYRRCERCRDWRLARRPAFSKSKNALLVLLTLGLWAPIAIATDLYTAIHSFRCLTCGGKC